MRQKTGHILFFFPVVIFSLEGANECSDAFILIGFSDYGAVKVEATNVICLDVGFHPHATDWSWTMVGSDSYDVHVVLSYIAGVLQSSFVGSGSAEVCSEPHWFSSCVQST